MVWSTANNTTNKTPVRYGTFCSRSLPRRMNPNTGAVRLELVYSLWKAQKTPWWWKHFEESEVCHDMCLGRRQRVEIRSSLAGHGTTLNCILNPLKGHRSRSTFNNIYIFFSCMKRMAILKYMSMRRITKRWLWQFKWEEMKARIWAVATVKCRSGGDGHCHILKEKTFRTWLLMGWR